MKKRRTKKVEPDKVYVKAEPFDDGKDQEEDEKKPSVVLSIPSLDLHMVKEGDDLIVKSGNKEMGRMDARPLVSGVKTAAVKLLPKFIKNPMIAKLAQQLLGQ